MIRVSVIYPNKPGARFDHKYYAEKHAALVNDRLKPLGMLRIEVDRGIAGATPDAPPPFVAVGHLIFSSFDGFQKAFGAHGAELLADVPNYTDIEPQIQVGEIQD